MAHDAAERQDDKLIHSFLALRKAVGAIAVLPPFVLWAANGSAPTKDHRSLVYRACGTVIVVCLALLAVHFAIDRWLGTGGVFTLETTMRVAFGVSWAVKGEGIGFLNGRREGGLQRRTRRSTA